MAELWPEVLAAVSLLNDDAEWVTVYDLAEELPHRTVPSLGASLGHLSRWGLVESREGWPGNVTVTRYALTQDGLDELDSWDLNLYEADEDLAAGRTVSRGQLCADLERHRPAVRVSPGDTRMSDRDARLRAIAALVRLHGPHKAVALVREADAAHAEGRAPDWMMLLEDLSAKAEKQVRGPGQ